ncbi:MAG: HPF/RaiA family ribosome-associated protein [Kiritimatiellae bacterium]|nr:HPF/RaiA family ribosome-associated protein [Kiritimatiellia bacterium]
MPIEVTVRHKGIGVDMQEYARNRAEEIVAEFPRIEYAHLILDKEKHLSLAEMIVQAGSHVRMEAAESDENMKVSVDSAVDKIERQLRKQMDKMQDHRSAKKHSESAKEGVE